MRWIALLVSMLAHAALAQERPPADIDPNTKTQGGADVRGSGANAGEKAEPEKARVEEERREAKDKPVAERKPREQPRETEEAAKGETAKPQ